MDLKNKACLVTGGTRGIGAATAILLAHHGANVAIVGRELDDDARDTAGKIESLGRRCLQIRADMALSEDVTRCVDETTAALGSPEVVVHSAGGPVPGSVLEISPDDWMRAFAVHVHAVYFLCRAAIPAMQRRKSGVIILVSSVAGIRGVPGSTCYQVVKGALPQFARALARDFANDNIRVNAIAPGVIRTRFHAAMPEQVKKNNLENRIPLHREGTAEQVASAVLELVRNDYITGETLTIDGGLTMRIA